MTSTSPESGETAEGPAMSVSVTVQSRPGGSWVALEFATAINRYAVAFPPEFARQMATTLPKGLTDAANDAERADSPLHLPS